MPVDASSDVAFAIEKLPPLDTLESLWRGLGSRDFFTSWDWIGTWLKTLPSRIEPHLIRAKRGDRTVALAIGVFKESERHLIVHVRQLHFNSTGEVDFDRITIEHNDFAGEGGLLPTFLVWFARGDCADELVVPGSSPANLARIPGLLRSTRQLPAFANTQLAPIMHTGIGSVLSRNARQQLNKSIRNVSRFGELRIEEAHDVPTAIAWFAALKEFHIASWSRRGKEHAFSTPYFETFHRALISTGIGQLLRVRAGTHVLGYLYNFHFCDTAYAYQSGFADENGNDRPGYVCHATAIEHYAKAGVAKYDFLAGDNRLKRTLGPSQYTLCWATFARPTAVLRLEAFLRWTHARGRWILARLGLV